MRFPAFFSAFLLHFSSALATLFSLLPCFTSRW
jgi:hypothetical protein